MVFMKGNPDQPRCGKWRFCLRRIDLDSTGFVSGFSKQLVAMLNEQGADYKTFDILSDENVRHGMVP